MPSLPGETQFHQKQKQQSPEAQGRVTKNEFTNTTITDATISANAGDKNDYTKAGDNGSLQTRAATKGDKETINHFTDSKFKNVVYDGNAGDVNKYKTGVVPRANPDGGSGGTRTVTNTLTEVEISGGEFNLNAGNVNRYT